MNRLKFRIVKWWRTITGKRREIVRVKMRARATRRLDKMEAEIQHHIDTLPYGPERRAYLHDQLNIRTRRAMTGL